jgi:hypothetical protein
MVQSGEWFTEAILRWFALYHYITAIYLTIGVHYVNTFHLANLKGRFKTSSIFNTDLRLVNILRQSTYPCVE